MKSIAKTIVFVIFTTCFVLVVCDHNITVEKVDITCEILNYDQQPTGLKFVLKNSRLDNIKDSCPRDNNQEKLITVEGIVKTLHKDSLKDLPSKTILNITNVGLEEIQPGSFKEHLNYYSLYFANNNVRELKSGTFVNLHVTWLRLERNSISVLQKGTFQNVSYLIDLSLRGNKLKEIEKGVFENVFVIYFNLEENNISRLEPGVFASVHRVQRRGVNLWLSNNSLEEINAEAFDNKYIKALSLANNSISILRPGDLWNLPNLESINLSGNKIEEVPEGVFRYKIEILDLSYNKISVIASRAFNNLIYLKIVKIDHNKLRVWNNQWFQGYLYYNIKIYASYNHITEIPANAFVHIPNGSSLDLDHNQIKNISDSAFYGVTYLAYLKLSSNKIQKWKVDLLKNVAIADFVDIRGNGITCSEFGTTSDRAALQVQRVVFDHC